MMTGITKKLPYLLLFLLALACQKELEPLLLEELSLTKDDLATCKNGPCPEIMVDYLLVSRGSKRASRINDTLRKRLSASLNFSPEEEPAGNIKAAALAMVEDYRNYKAEFPESQAGYEAEIWMEETYQSPELFCLALSSWTYAGGAHGYGTVQHLNFDAETGTILDNDALFEDLDGFTAFAKAQFKRKYNIPEEDNINSTGLWFENDTYYVPENVRIEKDTIFLRYDQYEIDSYAAGSQILALARKNVDVFLNFK